MKILMKKKKNQSQKRYPARVSHSILMILLFFSSTQHRKVVCFSSFYTVNPAVRSGND